VIARARSGGVWTGRFLGSVSRFADGEPLAEPIVRGLPPVTDLLEDPDSTLWVGTWRGLYRIRGAQRRSFAARDGLPDDVVERVYRDSGGTLWVATQTGIARAVRPGEERFTIQPMPEGSAERAVVLFEAPPGMLWLGSADGLARVTGGRPALLTVAKGLPENWVGAAERDGVGGLWLGQLAGLSRIDLADLAAVADGREPALRSATTYEALDGLPGGDPAAWPHPYSLRDASGRIWFAMGHGIAVVDPSNVGGNASAPLIHVEEVGVDGVVAPAGTTVTVAPTARRLELRYTGVDLTNGPRLRFRYRLDGFDPDWFEAGTQRAAAYTHLPPGRYRFRVTGRAPNGAWSPTEAAMDVVVLAPIYQRTWFLVIGSLALGLAAWTAQLALLRTRGEAVRAERSRLAREIHDSLLQGFGGIALQLHAASQELALPPQQQSRLDRVLSLIDRHPREVRVSEATLAGAGGQQLFTRSWRPVVGQPLAVVVIVPGFLSHSGYYTWVGEQLAAGGLAAHALDLRGRGKSNGERFYVETFDDYVDDVGAIVASASAQEPGVPVFMLGHSAGGVVGCLYALAHASDLAGLVCESFAYQLPAPDLALTILKGLSHLAPHAHVLKLAHADFSRDPAVVAAMDSDPLIAGESQPAQTVAAMVRPTSG
jgi:dienelactone hydrolase